MNAKASKSGKHTSFSIGRGSACKQAGERDKQENKHTYKQKTTNKQTRKRFPSQAIKQARCKQGRSQASTNDIHVGVTLAVRVRGVAHMLQTGDQSKTPKSWVAFHMLYICFTWQCLFRICCQRPRHSGLSEQSWIFKYARESYGRAKPLPQSTQTTCDFFKMLKNCPLKLREYSIGKFAKSSTDQFPLTLKGIA